MNPDEVTVILREIRTALGYTRGIMPVVDAVYAHEDGSLHIIVPDRAEKSMCLGPGGRIAAEFAKRVGHQTTFYGADELKIREHRLKTTLRRIDEIVNSLTENQEWMIKTLREHITKEIEYPKEKPEQIVMHSSQSAVAFSGGTDSCGTALLMKEMNQSTKLITVELGEEFLNAQDLKQIRAIGKDLRLPHKFIPAQSDHKNIVNRARAGEIHPCGPCHKSMYRAIFRYIRDSGIDVLITGELLPTGRQAIVLDRGVLVIHLPAALAMSKFMTLSRCNKYNIRPLAEDYGCRFVSSVLTPEWRMLGPSVFRVLRELEAGVVTTGQAQEQLKHLIKTAIRGQKKDSII